MKKIISIVITAAISAGMICSFSANALLPEKDMRLYFKPHRSKTVIRQGDFENGPVTVPVKIFIDDRTKLVFGLNVEYYCEQDPNGEYVKLKNLKIPTYDGTPFCYGALRPDGSPIGDFNYEGQIDEETGTLADAKHFRYNFNAFKGMPEECWLGNRSDDYMLTEFEIEFSPGTPPGNYTVCFTDESFGDTGNTTITKYIPDAEVLNYIPVEPVKDTVTFTVEPRDVSYKLGDVDANLKVDASDAAMALTAYALSSVGYDHGLTTAGFIAADVNNEGRVDAADAADILGYYAYVQTGGVMSSEEYFALINS